MFQLNGDFLTLERPMLPFPLFFVHMSYCVPVGGCPPLSQLSLPASCSSAGRPRHRLDHPRCSCYASHSCMRVGCPSCHPNNTRVVFFLDNYSLEKERGLRERWMERLIWCQWWNVIFFVAKIWSMFLTEQKKIVMETFSRKWLNANDSQWIIKKLFYLRGHLLSQIGYYDMLFQSTSKHYHVILT